MKKTILFILVALSITSCNHKHKQHQDKQEVKTYREKHTTNGIDDYLYWYVIYAIVHTINLSLSLMLIMQPLLIVQGNKFKIGHANIVQMLQH